VPHVRGHYRQGPWFRRVWVRPHYRRPQDTLPLLAILGVIVVVVFLIWVLTSR
jgi:hypothetical protein